MIKAEAKDQLKMNEIELEFYDELMLYTFEQTIQGKEVGKWAQILKYHK